MATARQPLPMVGAPATEWPITPIPTSTATGAGDRPRPATARIRRSQATSIASPQNLIYSVNGVQRQRTNGLVTLQFKPSDNVTATLDYAYSENKIQTQRNELSAWFGFCCGGGEKTYTDGPISAPIIYSENRRQRRYRHGWRELRHQDREQVPRFQCCLDRQRRLRAGVGRPQFVGRVGCGQPLWLERSAGYGQLHARQDHGRLEQGFPGAEHRVAQWRDGT